MTKSTISQIFSIILFGVMALCVGCKTEQQQNVPKNNDAMYGYAEDFTKAQADLINRDQNKKQTVTNDGEK
ncbi:hypothetical protein F901_03001 [Acinetobacter dispersus]|uniref:hypothetical protein n=1 Tax=Acinetobacter dispersus TaxID=70348 RepID=UPI0002CFBA8E|nr:hypothetical protein [Acinetobacter dispersus]ENX51813.1 hypothetical protein F901_03001 [Acinetobacter dispersus]